MFLRDKRRVTAEDGDDRRIEEESLEQLYQWRESGSYVAQGQEEFRTFLEVYYHYLERVGFDKYEENEKLLSDFIDAVIAAANQGPLDGDDMEAILEDVISSAQMQQQGNTEQEE